jgi:exosome complex RNA-binding protein Rrp4
VFATPLQTVSPFTFCSLQRELMVRSCRIMTTSLLATIIGALNAPYETAIGMNGRIWIHGASPVSTIALKRVLEAVDRGALDGEEREEVERWLKREEVMVQ